MSKKKIIILSIAGAMLIAACVVFWRVMAAPTRIAFVNYQAIALGQISRADDNSFIKVVELQVERVGEAGDYDMVFVNGMGLRITDEQRTALAEAAANGTPVLTTAATNPQNIIVSVDSADNVYLSQYLAGGRTNYRNLLRYVRRFIDGKTFFADMPADPQLSASSLIYYPSDDDNLDFATVAAYERFLRERGKWSDDAPRIILTGQMGVPDSLVAALECIGNVVYPVNSIQLFIKEGHADSVAPSAVVNMAHGRMGDMVVEYLKEHNVPLFSPLNVNRSYDDWMNDNMGMNGGFLSQSVVTPEIDGALRPYSLFAHYEGEDGLPYVAAIPDRLDSFVASVNACTQLQRKANKDKRVAIFYFKGPGQNALVAEGMEVAPSLYNLLCRLRSEGYDVGVLPSSSDEFERLMNENGKVFGNYASGAKAEFVKTMNPEIITRQDYDGWCADALSPEMRTDIDAVDGEFPGHGLAAENGCLALARLRFGNVVLIPQTAAGVGGDDFKMVHGTDAAPPHNYVAAYLWARYGFGADALMHFGAHGSLEFTPRKQVALGCNDWPDRLVGPLPHVYVYSTGNVGEAMMAKRRSYAGIVNYLTPPFMESEVRGIYRRLTDAVAAYNRLAGADRPDENALRRASLAVKKQTVELGIHRELRLDSVLSEPYTADDIARVENFAEELANEKITGALYVMGQPYADEHIRSTVYAMTVEPIAYSLYRLDRIKGRTDIDYERNRARFTARYGARARNIVDGLYAGGAQQADDAVLCRTAGITPAELDSARRIMAAVEGSKDMLSRMMVMGAMSESAQPRAAKIADRPNSTGHKGMMAGMSPEKALVPVRDFSKDELDFAMAVQEVERAMRNVGVYGEALRRSPGEELSSVVNALAGGYVAPTSGGDPVLNPEILPTGRNMYAVNAEETPSAVAWEKGKELADNTIAMYRKAHGDSIPRKVSYTLWSSEFIETGGATIAQVLYMLGVEPVRDSFGRVTDLRLIPSSELRRPRIDVVVQTSGQLRDLAASRLFLISRAVQMAALAEDTDFPNYVAEGVVESERHLVERGVTPKEARELSTARVFGGVNGNYGSGIQGMVEAGDRWTDRAEIAETYINNMGAIYGSEEDWEKMCDYAFEAALTRTDVVVQPRQSNTWGALSLDHVYEFMGGMNLAVSQVTGKEPDAYLSDYRNRNRARMQEVKEAIGVESRTTILNPAYIKAKMKGGAGDASGLADIVRNTYGWNVMKPDVIDNELWNDIYDTYVADKHGLGVTEYFKDVNPAAIEEITAVMLETARKGMWQASDEQLARLAELHTGIVNEYRPSCSGFVCDNASLRDFIASKVPAEIAAGYNKAIGEIRVEADGGAADDGMVMHKAEMNTADSVISRVNGVVVAVAVVLVLAIFVVVVRRRRHKNVE